MFMYDLLAKKKSGGKLSQKEIAYMVQGFTSGEIPDYQMSAMLMAICFRGMTDEELSFLTDAMVCSGDRLDLSSIPGSKADKHSTGGVGDKTTLIAVPLAAACGLKIAKLSGRALGHTGGTVDKLESIPGLRTSLSEQEFFQIVRQAGLAVAGQSADLAPADKKLYALRDMTATVDCIPLIASSIMSKKLAAGSDCIVLDVKTGSGAFMKSVAEAASLAEKMAAIGKRAGKQVAALITDMDRPLGHTIGNSLEVIEAVETLRGHGSADLTELSVVLAAQMLHLAARGDMRHCQAEVREALASGKGFQKLRDMVLVQGGDVSYLDDTAKFPRAYCQRDIIAEYDGYIAGMDMQAYGRAAAALGAGRKTKDSCIDHASGIELCRTTGDYVHSGEKLAVLYGSSLERLDEAEKICRQAISFSESKPVERPLILAVVDANGRHDFEEAG